MPFSFLGGITSGFMDLMAGYHQNQTTREVNDQNVALQRETNAANLAHAEKWNQMNYDLAREAQDAQLAQQQWANERYVESVDYDRALQQEIFNREDTALQRAMGDATAAGFSPLAALGVPAGAGQVVGSSSTPGSMVSNNQASVQSANQVSPQLQGLTGMSNSLSSIGSMIATMAENMSARQHQRDMQNADIAAQYKRLGMDKVYEWLIQDDQQDFLDNQRIATHLDNFTLIAETAKFDMALEEIRQRGAQSLQDDAQAHDLQMQQNEQQFESDYRVKTASAVYEESLKLGKEILIPVIREFSPNLADWMENNSFGTDFLVQIVRSVESAAPLIEQVGDAVKSVSPVRQFNPFSK